MGLKLFVISHKDVDIPVATYLYPIRSNRTDGIQIAEKESYSELRAQYWVWKNERFDSADYVGFFHYRRYLDLDKEKLFDPSLGQKRPLPYRIKRKPDARVYSHPEIETLATHFDVIAPVWEYTGVPVWKRYNASKKQRAEDLKKIYQIVSDRYPSFVPAANHYLSGSGEYYGNIYIMRGDYFRKYCSWLFDILTEFDRRTPDAPPFTDGFLGERLFGIYFTWLTWSGVRCGELPRLHFSIYDDEAHHAGREYLVNLLLRPGSKLRGQLRKTIYRLG